MFHTDLLVVLIFSLSLVHSYINLSIYSLLNFIYLCINVSSSLEYSQQLQLLYVDVYKKSEKIPDI